MLLQRKIIHCSCRYINTSIVNYNGKYLLRQGKFMKKMIFGEIPKKKWYLSRNDKPSEFITPTTITVSPHVTRRVVVLNKLFMRYVTDLMATGEISSEILGRGIEVSRVSINRDFKLCKVFWFSSKSTAKELIEISDILKNCAYKLRHELSQLKVIGVVPPIQFFQDKQLTCTVILEKKFRNADYGDDYTPTITAPPEPQLTLYVKLPNVIREKILDLESSEKLNDCEEEDDEKYDIDLPPMKHDVLGLNHLEIMSKVNYALKRCQKTANDRRNQSSIPETRQPFEASLIYSLRTNEETEAFNEFLLNRRIQEKKRKEMKQKELIDMRELQAQALSDDDYDDQEIMETNSTDDDDYIDDNYDDNDIQEKFSDWKN